jgi:AraC-like DNA-binding protein
MNNLSTINISWLQNTLRSLAVFVVLSFAVSILQYQGNLLLFEICLIVLLASLVIFISSVLFKALEEPHLFIFKASEKYTSSCLSKEQKQEIAEKIWQVLEQSKIFLKPETTLSDLANLIGCTPRNASQVINEVFNRNFFELINDYRVREAKKIIEKSQDPKLTILEVMYQVGFNSKSSFNTQFKKIVGITPSEFRKLHQ